MEKLSAMVDFEAYNGSAKPELPLTATYIITPEGVIAYAFIDADYRHRAEPSDIIGALQKLLPAS